MLNSNKTMIYYLERKILNPTSGFNSPWLATPFKITIRQDTLSACGGIAH
ncbi:MAG: hypothetical protein HOJ79_01680 [Nitrospina sp.]|nr:hypothetical protein [Nitrospina sp.]